MKLILKESNTEKTIKERFWDLIKEVDEIPEADKEPFWKAILSRIDFGAYLPTSVVKSNPSLYSQYSTYPYILEFNDKDALVLLYKTIKPATLDKFREMTVLPKEEKLSIRKEVRDQYLKIEPSLLDELSDIFGDKVTLNDKSKFYISDTGMVTVAADYKTSRAYEGVGESLTADDLKDLLTEFFASTYFSDFKVFSEYKFVDEYGMKYCKIVFKLKKNFS